MDLYTAWNHKVVSLCSSHTEASALVCINSLSLCVCVCSLSRWSKKQIRQHKRQRSFKKNPQTYLRCRDLRTFRRREYNFVILLDSMTNIVQSVDIWQRAPKRCPSYFHINKNTNALWEMYCVTFFSPQNVCNCIENSPRKRREKRGKKFN